MSTKGRKRRRAGWPEVGVIVGPLGVGVFVGFGLPLGAVGVLAGFGWWFSSGRPLGTFLLVSEEKVRWRRKMRVVLGVLRFVCRRRFLGR